MPGLSPRAPVRRGALRAGRAPAAGGFLMITARWAQPPHCQDPPLAHQGHLRPSARRRLASQHGADPRNTQNLYLYISVTRQHPPIRPSCAGRAAQPILNRPCNAHSQGSACGSVQTIFWSPARSDTFLLTPSSSPAPLTKKCSLLPLPCPNRSSARFPGSGFIPIGPGCPRARRRQCPVRRR